MPLIRKAGYGLCRDTTQKKLLRLQSGWFNCSLLSSGYCARTTANQFYDATQYSNMQTACWNLFNPLGTNAWVAGASGTWCAPLYFLGMNKAISLGYPWINECTQTHAFNRFQLPSILTGYTITAARIWLESPGETWRWFDYSSGGQFISDEWYVPATPIGGAINIGLSASLQVPAYAWNYPAMALGVDVLNANSYAVVDAEEWNAFSGAGVSRFAAGAWGAYDFSSSNVSWLNSNRTFYVYLNWTTGYANYIYHNANDFSTRSRSIRGLVLQVYCEL